MRLAQTLHRLEQRALELFFVLFALWTVCSNIAAYTGLTLYTLLGMYACGLVLLFFASRTRAFRARFGNAPAALSQPADALLLPEQTGRTWWFALFAAGLLVLFFFTRNCYLFWWGCVLYFGLAFWQVRKQLPDDVPAAARQAAVFIWIVALAMVCVVLLMHRAHPDDVNYVSTAAWFADHPGEPVFSKEPRHPAEDLPYLFVPYRSESLPSLAAGLSVLTGVPAIYLLHLLLPALAALVCVFAQGGLLRELLPKHWPWALVALQIVYLSLGNNYESWGNVAYARLNHGKSVFLILFVPAIMTYTLKLGRTFQWRSFALLTASLIGAHGYCSTAIWAGPAVFGMTLLAALPGIRGHVRRTALTLTSVAYPFCIGVLVLLDSSHSPVMQHIRAQQTIELYSSKINVDYLNYAFQTLFAWQPLAFFLLFATLSAWLVCPTIRARRFCIIYPLVFFGFFLNPYLAPLIAEKLTTPFLYWRLFWILPVPLFAAFLLSAPVLVRRWKNLGLLALALGCGLAVPLSGLPGFGFSFAHKAAYYAGPEGLLFAALCLACFGGLAWLLRSGGSDGHPGLPAFALFLCAVCAYWIFFPTTYVLSRQNRVEVRRPGLKVHPGDYRAASWLSAHLGPQDKILAPRKVSIWVTTFSKHPSPLITVRFWDNLMRGVWTDADVDERVWLRDYTMGFRPDVNPERFRKDLDRYTLKAVCIKQSVAHLNQARAVLKAAGFHQAYEHAGLEVWLRT